MGYGRTQGRMLSTFASHLSLFFGPIGGIKAVVSIASIVYSEYLSGRPYEGCVELKLADNNGRRDAKEIAVAKRGLANWWKMSREV